MSDGEGMVISLATGAPIERNPRPSSVRSSCLHLGWVVDEKGRSLTCQECGKDVDPFRALARVAREYDQVRDAQEEHRRMLEVISNLEAQEKKAKARIRNANRKDADAAVAEERALWERRLHRSRRNAQALYREAQTLLRNLADDEQRERDRKRRAKR